MINFAIIGCGRIANRHAGHILKINLIASLDIDEIKVKEFGENTDANLSQNKSIFRLYKR